MAGRSRGSRPGDSLLASAEGEGHPMVPNFVPYGTKFRCPVRPCDPSVPGEDSVRARFARVISLSSPAVCTRRRRLSHQPVNFPRPSGKNCAPKQVKARPKRGVLQRAPLAPHKEGSAQEFHPQATRLCHAPHACRRENAHMSHGSGGSSHFPFPQSCQGSGHDGKTSDERSSRANPARNFLQGGLRFEQVLQNVQENSDVIVGRQVKSRIFEIRFEKIIVTCLAQLFGQHDGINSRPLLEIRVSGHGSKELQHLAGMHPDFGNFEPPAAMRGFLAQQVIAEPVAKQTNRISNRFRLRRDTEAFRTDRLIVREKGESPTELRKEPVAQGRASCVRGKAGSSPVSRESSCARDRGPICKSATGSAGATLSADLFFLPYQERRRDGDHQQRQNDEE